MNARTFTTATLLTAFAGVLPAFPADSQLLSLVMPDAKVLAGVNVDSAKASPFGMYVLTQIQSNSTALQQLIALTGFDPTRDVDQVLAATDATPGSTTPTGLLLARGTFDPTIATLATAKGAVTEVYNGATIIEDPQKLAGIAFLSSTLAVAGDIGSVKAAIDRSGSSPSLPSAVLAQVNQWSASEDAWIITTVPLASLAPSGAASGAPAGTAPSSPMAGVLQQVQQIAGGVKFGNSVVGTAVIKADNAADATQLANTMQFLVNLAQMQSQNNAQMTNLAQGFSVNAQGTAVNVTVTLPAAQFQQLFQMEKKAAVATPHTGR
jgi:hypothetical protein